MKRTRNEVQGKASRPLTLQFDPQPLTAFSGLILFQHYSGRWIIPDSRCKSVDHALFGSSFP